MIWTWLKKWWSSSKVNTDPDPMKYLIVGLGNMGAEYDGTRHNIGFDVIDLLAGDAEFKNEMHGDLTVIKHKGRTLYLLKPSTYMNLSGKAVRYWCQKLKLQSSNLMVIVDDLNLTFGNIRMRGKGSDGGHNGLADIQQKLGTTQYNRMRIGIGNDFHKGQQVDFVLGKWSAEEAKHVQTIISKCAEAVKDFCSIGMKRAMDKHNGKAFS